MWPFTLALWAGTLRPGGGLVTAALGAAVAAAAVRVRTMAAGAAIAMLGLGLVGSGLAGARVRLVDQALLARLAAERAEVVIVARAASDARPTAGGWWQLAAASRVGDRRVRERLLLRWPHGSDPPAWGSRVRAVGTLRPLGRDGFAGHVRLLHGVASLRARHHEQVAAAGWAWRIAEGVRSRAAAAFRNGLDDRRAALLAGLVLGVPPPAELDAAFDAAGLSHLLVVSGQHAVWVTALLVTAGAVGGLGFRARRGAALLGLGWLVLLVRPQPSVLRAAAAVGLVLLAQLAGRPIDALRTLAVAVAALLLVDPLLGPQLGFQLSVAAVAGLLLWARRTVGGAAPRRLRRLLAATAAAQLAVTPLLVWRLGEAPLLAVAANAVAIPLATAAQAAGALAGAAAQWSIPVGGALAGLAALPAAALLAVAGLFAHAPMVRAPALPAPVLRLLPGTLPAQVTALTLHALDVGQGDALLVEAPGPGRAARMLVDAGPDPAEAAEQLRRLGVERLALAVLTHGDLDHSGGMAAVLERVPVGALVIGPHPPLATGSPAQRALEAAHRRGVPVVRVHAGQWLQLGAAAVEVLGPPREGFADAPPNEHSLVLRLHGPGGRILLTGDSEVLAQEWLLRRPARLRAEVLKVPHHGGDTNADGFLQAVRPHVAVITVGADNPYGHPHPDVLGALAGAQIRRTDLEGRLRVALGEGTAAASLYTPADGATARVPVRRPAGAAPAARGRPPARGAARRGGRRPRRDGGARVGTGGAGPAGCPNRVAVRRRARGRDPPGAGSAR
jgi:competence protein ComEC